MTRLVNLKLREILMLYSSQPSLIYVYQAKTISANHRLNSMARGLEANVGKSLTSAWKCRVLSMF